MNPGVRSFFRRQLVQGILKQSRIGHVLAARVATSLISKVVYDFQVWSDHARMEVILRGVKGRSNGGLWILNNSILGDQEYVRKVRTVLQFGIDEMHGVTDVYRWWEALKLRLKRMSIAYCKKRNQRASEEERGVKEILNKEAALLAVDKSRDAVVYNAALSRLKDFEEEWCRAASMRARVRDFVDGERSSAFFLGWEKRKQEKAVISSFRNSVGELCTELTDILETVEVFYRDLFSGRGCDDAAVEACFQHITSRLRAEDVDFCEANVTDCEIKAAIVRQHNNKSPGVDVLTAEFYKVFQDELVPILGRVYEIGFHEEGFSPSFCFGAVKLFYKGKGDKCILENYRPITLLNLDYKILASVLAGRLREVIPSIVSSKHAYGVPGRDIANVLLSLRHTIDYMEHSGGILLCVDFVKAFDRVEHAFLWRVLERFGFGPTFISRLRKLYVSATSPVVCNRLRTGVFPVGRSVRQGCPLSAMLYSMTVEPLALMISADRDLRGVVTPAGREVKLFQFADDTSLVLRDEEGVHKVLGHLTSFCCASGAEVNLGKSEILFLGDKVGTTTNWTEIGS